MYAIWTTLALAPLLLAVACAAPEEPAQRVAVAESSAVAEAAEAVRMVVYKTPTCGCCSAWVDHVREHGFAVEAVDTSHVELQEIKRAHGVPAGATSCHTAIVDGYVVEGHVPAGDIARLLRERPAIRGLAVPGMPMGSPGMEGVVSQRYDVIAIGKDGEQSVFASH